MYSETDRRFLEAALAEVRARMASASTPAGRRWLLQDGGASPAASSREEGAAADLEGGAAELEEGRR